MCRTVFALRDIEEITVEQIATMVNRSVAAVEVCLLRARLLLSRRPGKSWVIASWSPTSPAPR